MKLFLASRLSKRSAAPFSLLSRPPSAPRLRRVERHKGHAKRLFDFLGKAGCLMAVEKAKVRQAVKRHDVLPPGVVLLFSRFCQSILTAMCLTRRGAMHLREECRVAEWKRPCVKRYGRCARSPPLQRTSGAVTRRVLTLWNF